jgi:hypothetical protein
MSDATKIIDLPPDHPARRYIHEAIDKQIVEMLTPERVFDVLQAALLTRERDNVETRKLWDQVWREFRKTLIPRDELTTKAGIGKWVELTCGRFNSLLNAAVWKELDAAMATGRVAHVGGGNYRVRPPSKRKLRCRTARRKEKP